MINYQKRFVVSLLWGAMLLGACSDNVQPEAEKELQDYSLIVRFADASGYDSAAEFAEVDVYRFSDGEFYGTETLEPGADGGCVISAYPGSRLYLMAGLDVDCADGISEEEFLSIPVSGEFNDGSVTEFMTSSIELSAGGRPSAYSVYMTRGVARIDLNTTADQKTRIDRIIVEDAPEKTFPFGNGTIVPEGCIALEKSFAPAFSGRTEGVFRLFESDAPVNVVLHGTYDGVPVMLRTSLPRVARNKIYELAIFNVGSSLEASFAARPWEEGETVVGKPDSGQRIMIDEGRSVIPDGVSVDAGQNVVEVPEYGVSEMTLAFAGDAPVDICSVDGTDGSVTVGEVSVTEEDGKIISSFNVSVAAQGSGRLGYSVFVHLRNALMTGSYDYVEIRVSESADKLWTVEIGGSVWMAFNARSNDLDDQVYTLDGLDVDGMYTKSWINTVGGLFQFGRLYMYVPWQGYSPSNNLGNQTADVPWQSDTHMPCPEGYRIPTRAELESLLPKGTTIPGTYTAGNGETITASLHVAEGTLQTPTNVSGTQHFVRLVSNETGNTLTIPLAGGKGDKSTTNNPAFGKRAVLWTSGRDGCPGGYAWAYWLPFEGNETAVIAERQLQMEAFASVRCVKK